MPGLGPGGGEAVCVSIPFLTSGNLGIRAEFASARGLHAQVLLLLSSAAMPLWALRGTLPAVTARSPGVQARRSQRECLRAAVCGGGRAAGDSPCRFGSLRCQSCCPVTQATVTRPEASSPFLSPFRVRWPTLDTLSYVLTSYIELHKQKVFLAKYNNSHSSLQVFQQPKTQEEVCQLSINIMQVLCKSTDALKPEIMRIISLPSYS